MNSGIQKQVGVQPGVGIEGDFCDSNPRYTVDAGPGGIVAGSLGLLVGRFAWLAAAPVDVDGGPQVANNFGFGIPDGFMHSDQQGLITDYLGVKSLKLPGGFQATLFKGGGFWVRTTTVAYRGMKAYADLSDGSVSFAATGTPATGATSTASTIAAGTASVTAGIDNDIMTVSAVGSGVLYKGAVLSGTNVVSGTQIVDQISGAAGGIGVYRVTNPGQSVAAGTTVSVTYGLLTIGGTLTGAFEVGDIITGSGITGTQLTDRISGTGGAGTYVVNKTQVVSSQAINAQSNIETAWVCELQGPAGSLVKMTNGPRT